MLRSYQTPSQLHRAVEKSGKGTRSRPLESVRDESFLDALGQEVSESIDLSFGLFGDRDMRVASSPDLLVPVGQPTDLSGEVAADVAHESGQLVGVLGRDNEVVVIRQEDEGVNRHVEELLGSAEDADDDSAQLGRWPEQESALEGPLGDLHGETWRNMAEAAWHAKDKNGKRGRDLRF